MVKRIISSMKQTLLLAFLAIPLIVSGCGSAGAAGGNSVTTLTLYSSGDVNVKDLWQRTLIPEFKKIHPEIDIKLVFSEHGANDEATIARLSAAKSAGKDAGIDLLEGGVTDAVVANLMRPLSSSDIPLIDHIDPALMQQVNSMAIPYRASSVVLAYNSQYVTTPPQTVSELLAWVKAHPGKFTYNTPDSGGSGNAFVENVLRSHITDGAQKNFTTGTDYNQTLESQWQAGLNDLKSLKSSVYNNGFYPNGNTAVLQLLANSSIWVAPVWSDQALTALATHQLPDSIKLIQLDQPFSGGPSFIGIPVTSPHAKQASIFLNWVLDSTIQANIINIMNGYPGVKWDYISDTVRQKYASIARSYATSFSSKYSADMHKLWQSQVAGG